MDNHFIKQTLLGLLTLVFVCSSCSQNKAGDLLRKAQNVVETEPATALSLLDSVRSPQQQGERFYMEYIVSHFLAKSKLGQDITGDSLILQANQYFDRDGDTNNKAIASFCTGVFYGKKGLYDKSLKYFLEADQYAHRTDNYLIQARSNHNIAIFYYDQKMWDQAIKYYKRAYTFYRNSGSSTVDNAKLNVLTSIGNSYQSLVQLDSAETYINQTLKQATQINNKEYIAHSYQNLGLIFFDRHDYTKAKEYLYKGLPGMPNVQDSIITYINLTKVCNATNQLDSAKYYTAKVENRLSAVKDYYILTYLYEVLADYNKMIGHFEQAYTYKELELKAEISATNTDEAVKLTNAQQKFTADLQKYEVARVQERLTMLLSATIVIIVLIAIALYLRARNAKLKLREQITRNELLKNEIDLRDTQKKLLYQEIDNYSFMEDVYEGIVNVWSRIQNKVYELVQRRLPEEDRELYKDFNNLWKYLTEVCNSRFEKRGRDMLIEETDPNKAEAALLLMDRNDLLLIMYLRLEYKDVEICTLLKCDDLPERKECLLAKLSKAGYTEKEIKKILSIV